jgi:cysteinyl-tRNA synthetase
METKDFAQVDQIKTMLLAAGVQVKMSKEGVSLTPTPDFDAAKLEALK